MKTKVAFYRKVHVDVKVTTRPPLKALKGTRVALAFAFACRRTRPRFPLNICLDVKPPPYIFLVSLLLTCGYLEHLSLPPLNKRRHLLPFLSFLYKINSPKHHPQSCSSKKTSQP